jgi:hypothetical protein
MLGAMRSFTIVSANGRGDPNLGLFIDRARPVQRPRGKLPIPNRCETIPATGTR